MPTTRKIMADSSNLNSIELNGLNLKTDSLPNDWLITLVNPKTGESAENMTIARLIELLPFLSTSGGTIKSTLEFGFAANGEVMIKDKLDIMQIGVQMNSSFAYIGYGVKYKKESLDIVSTRYQNEPSIYFMYLFANDGIYFAATDRTRIPVGDIVQNFTFKKVVGTSNINAFSLTPNNLTEAITEQVPISADTPMTLQEDGQPAPAIQTVERYEYSIPKMAEAILALQKELDELKGGVGE